VVGVVAAVSALADAFDDSSAASVKSSSAIKRNTEEARAAAAERKQIEDNYEKAVGISLDRQIAKRKAQLDQDTKAVEDKFSQDLKAAQGNAVEEERLVSRMLEDKRKVQDNYFADVDKMRKDDLKKQQDDANTELRNQIEHLRRLGLDRDADSLDIAAKNQAERKSVEEHYRQIEESAKASGRVLVGIEQQKDADLEQLRKNNLWMLPSVAMKRGKTVTGV